MLMTQRRLLAVLQDEDWMFTIAQSPDGLDFRHVGADPRYPRRRAAGPNASRRATLSSSRAVTGQTLPHSSIRASHLVHALQPICRRRAHEPSGERATFHLAAPSGP